jgi:trans-aconitate methyltransferase
VSEVDRRRSHSFGVLADLYDRARPSYPAALVDMLLSEPAQHVLDIGCGTGKGGRLFRERGCDVLGVEHDPQMAAVARRHGLTVEVARFEEWEPGERRFDLAICAQAWHWLDHAVAVPKVAGALVPGGRLAAFWNFGIANDELQRAFAAVYARHAPEFEVATTVGCGAYFDRAGDPAETLSPSEGFVSVDVLTFPWEHAYSTQAWIDQLRTHSDHALLPETTRHPLLAALAAEVDRRGGTIEITYRTRLVLARRR